MKKFLFILAVSSAFFYSILGAIAITIWLGKNGHDIYSILVAVLFLSLLVSSVIYIGDTEDTNQ